MFYTASNPLSRRKIEYTQAKWWVWNKPILTKREETSDPGYYEGMPIPYYAFDRRTFGGTAWWENHMFLARLLRHLLSADLWIRRDDDHCSLELQDR
ncbi:hypothetical protein PRIPAC_96739 [Pristionchus pacificus]|uniref:Uncharacterized protein n=1 Tax=Pristionchus pacificus TaxID=54126 RepID=A0A2A6CGT5_PRIPA|nr:hypothetical protein PRIPAC_96739 [Pristionchus pacificus]|eukprot:PDM77434.1 hypothetical protein PRIPAC_33164 [Pristionchus pacificus]